MPHMARKSAASLCSVYPGCVALATSALHMHLSSVRQDGRQSEDDWREALAGKTMCRKGPRSSSLEREVMVKRRGAANTQQTVHVQGGQCLDDRHQLACYRNVESGQLNCWGLWRS